MYQNSRFDLELELPDRNFINIGDDEEIPISGALTQTSAKGMINDKKKRLVFSFDLSRGQSKA